MLYLHYYHCVFTLTVFYFCLWIIKANVLLLKSRDFEVILLLRSIFGGALNNSEVFMWINIAIE